MHVDLAPAGPDGRFAELARLVAIGAGHRAELSDDDREVLVDPDGNELWLWRRR